MKKQVSKKVVEQLRWFFLRNGYVRHQNAERKKKEGWTSYKKGDEVRLVANSRAELVLLRRLLHRAGLRLGRPFPKCRQFRQPIYGRDIVARFLNLVTQLNDPPISHRKVK